MKVRTYHFAPFALLLMTDSRSGTRITARVPYPLYKLRPQRPEPGSKERDEMNAIAERWVRYGDLPNDATEVAA